MIELGKPHLQDSVVSDDKGGYVSSGRTSRTSWIDHDHDEITTRISQKISKQVNIPIENAEKFQLVHYGETHEYRAHYDSWDHDGSEKALRCIRHGGPRMVTALVYLNEVEEGGSTRFTKLNKDVSPKIGKLLVFENVYKNTINKHYLSEHAGMPVIKGEKYIFNLWFRQCSRKMLYSEFNPSYYEIKDAPKAKIEHIDLKDFNKLIDSKNIYTKKDFLERDICRDLIRCCDFPSGVKIPTYWLNISRRPDIIAKIEKTFNLDSRFFENMNIVKYSSSQIHGPYFDAYDLKTENGKKHTEKLGQRLQTISISLSEAINFKFDGIQRNLDMTTGTILFYDNVTTSEQRDQSLQHTVTNRSSENGYLLNIYVRKYDARKNINPQFKELEAVTTENIQITMKDTEPEDPIQTYNEVLTLFEEKKVTENWPGHKSFKYFFKGEFNYFNESVLKFNEIVKSGGGLRKEHLETDYKFDEYNPVVVENVVGEELSELLKTYYRTSITNGVFLFGDKQAQRFKANNEPFSRFLHYEILPLVRKITGRPVRPTYTYLSSYIKDADLPPHTDRPDCEYTVSFLVNKSHDWPIYAHKIKQPTKNKGRYWDDVPLEECHELHSGPNGLIIFCGTDHVHFRQVFTGDFYDILLLHYRED